MSRADLIGNGKQHLVPTYQPVGTGRAHEGRRKSASLDTAQRGSRSAKAASHQPFKTQHTGLPVTPATPAAARGGARRSPGGRGPKPRAR
jgi:hypothetical protein